MGDLLLWLMGKDPTQIPKDAHTQFMWMHAPKSWMVFVMVAIVAGLLYGVFRLYRRELDSCPPGWKFLLGCLRGLVVILLALVLMGPALSVSIHKTIEPFVILLLDDSLSMSIRDRYKQTPQMSKLEETLGRALTTGPDNKPLSRAEITTAVIKAKQGKFLRQLSERGKLRILTFSDKVKLRESIPGTTKGERSANENDNAGSGMTLERADPVPPLIPAGPGTNLGRGIRESLKALAGQPLAGIVLMSDGQNTVGIDPGQMASKAASLGVPIFPIGIGDPAEPRNIKVTDLWIPERVFRNDPVLIQATIAGRGFDGTFVEVKLISKKIDAHKEDGSAEVILGRKRITLSGANASTKISMQTIPTKAGKFVYSIRVPAQPDELLTDDNNKSNVVTVLDEQAKVLLIAGGPSWDYRLIKNLLIRDKTINLSCWLQSMSSKMQQEGNTPIKRLPDSPKDLFAYDVILFLDPNPDEFNEAWIAKLKEFLAKQAGGMLFMAGPQYTMQFTSGGGTRGIRELLPVRLSDLNTGIFEAMGTTHTRAWPLHIRAEGVDHPMLQIKKNTRAVAQLWESVPGVFWSFPLSKAKPAAQVLLEHSNPRFKRDGRGRPLLVCGQFGPGRTVYLGFSGSWRWRRRGIHIFEQFWIQTIRYLLEGRLSLGRRRGRIILDREVYAVGDRMAISAKVYDTHFKPLEVDVLKARVGGGDSQEVISLKPIPGRLGHFEGSSFARHLGINKVVITLQGDEGKPVNLVREFNVEIPNIEFADPRMNQTILTNLAKGSNGQYFDVWDWETVAAAIPDKRETTVVRGKPIELWDTNRVLFLFVFLLTIEWIIRKRFQLM